MGIMKTLRERLGVGEQTTFSAVREGEIKDGQEHPGIVVELGGVRVRISAGDFSKALGSGERVKAEVLGDAVTEPKRAI